MVQTKSASLFVGRWQPFHEGHQALVETVLSKGKPVVIAIRDTELSQKNPYTVNERWGMIQKALHQYGELVKIIVIPDIDEVCYGRDVGYGIRKIELSDNLHAVSGTNKRKEKPPVHPILWLTGQSGAGKTTLARTLKQNMPELIILDGNEMRESISLGADFSKIDRSEHNLRIARLALVLGKQAPVVVSVIAPFAAVRAQIDALIHPLWIYLTRNESPATSETYPYEPPEHPHLALDGDSATPEENACAVLSLLEQSHASAVRSEAPRIFPESIPLVRAKRE